MPKHSKKYYESQLAQCIKAHEKRETEFKAKKKELENIISKFSLNEKKIEEKMKQMNKLKKEIADLKKQ